MNTRYINDHINVKNVLNYINVLYESDKIDTTGCVNNIINTISDKIKYCIFMDSLPYEDDKTLTDFITKLSISRDNSVKKYKQMCSSKHIMKLINKSINIYHNIEILKPHMIIILNNSYKCSRILGMQNFINLMTLHKQLLITFIIVHSIIYIHPKVRYIANYINSSGNIEYKGFPY